MANAAAPVELLVCTKCRPTGYDGLEEAQRPGAALFGALSAERIEGITVTPVECLSNCSRGCTIALRGGDRWIYVYGGLDAKSDVATIREGAMKYRDTADGLVPWRERSEHFKRNCIARIPPPGDSSPAPEKP
jgi:predicted metal-binding protein